jgi:hypothetical protein
MFETCGENFLLLVLSSINKWLLGFNFIVRITDINVIKCTNVYKFIEKYYWPTQTHTHTHTNKHTQRWAGIPIVTLMRIYDGTCRLRIHGTAMTYVIGQQRKWKKSTKFLFSMLHKFCIAYNIDVSDKRHFDDNTCIKQENL